MAADLHKAEVEQARWQSVWGNGGRYGFENNSKVFLPNGPVSNLDGIGFIDLKRTETIEDHKTLITGVATETPIDGDKHDFKRRRFNELQTLLGLHDWVHFQ